MADLSLAIGVAFLAGFCAGTLFGLWLAYPGQTEDD